MSAHLAALTPRAAPSPVSSGIVYGAFFLGTILASPFAGRRSAPAIRPPRWDPLLRRSPFMLSSALTLRLSHTPPIAHVAASAAPPLVLDAPRHHAARGDHHDWS
jgi:hypothetical protein